MTAHRTRPNPYEGSQARRAAKAGRPGGSLISVFVWSMPRISIRRDVSACINDADYWDGEKETAKVRALPSE